MPKGKLNLELVHPHFHEFEHCPQTFITRLMKKEEKWAMVDEDKIQKFFIELNDLYKDEEDEVPYHNLTHGFDVAITLDKFLIEFSEFDHLAVTEFDRICMLIAAYAHDNGHQGFNNYYYISNHLQLALQYSYISPLQNMHASNLMRLLHKHNLPLQMEHKKFMVSLILATDMSHHFLKIEQLSENIQKYKGELKTQKDRIFVAEVLIHAADLNNPTKPTEQHVVWSQKVSIQFANQVINRIKQRKKQEELGTAVMLKVRKPGEGESNFIDKIVFPFYQQLVLLNENMQTLVENLKKNSDYWKKVTEQHEQN